MLAAAIINSSRNATSTSAATLPGRVRRTMSLRCTLRYTQGKKFVVSALRYPAARYLSSNGADGRNREKNRRRGGFKLDALAFSVSPERALDEFREWAIDEQGLRFLVNWDAVTIGAAYVPVWSFDVNVRFATSGGSGRGVRFDAKPEPFAIFQNDVVHLPGLSAYAGYSFRRTLVNPVHNTSLVFMGDKVVPFGSWMLRDMELSNGQTISVVPDAWNSTRGRAFSVVVEELENLAKNDEDRIGPCEVQTEILGARRVFMPTFVVDYTVLGGEYRAFISGCDAASGVSGVDHRAFSFSNKLAEQASNSFLTGVHNVTRWGRSLGAGPLIAVVNILLNTAARILARFHIIGAIGAGFVAFRKIIKPWMDNRTATAEWERQRENEAYMQEDHWDHTNDFVDSGYARKYFHRHRTQILRHLGGEQVHDSGDFDWYKRWEDWARQQWEQQQKTYEQQTWQQQKQREQYQRRSEEQWTGDQRQQTQRQEKKRAKKDFVWDFDPSDPYSVLGVRRDATKQQVSEAFRREMLKYHPDTQGTEATEAERERALERSKLVTDAYRKIKTQMK